MARWLGGYVFSIERSQSSGQLDVAQIDGFRKALQDLSFRCESAP